MNSDHTSNTEINQLVIKVLSGQATAGETDILQMWIQQSEENKIHFLRLRNTWDAAAQAITPDARKTMKALDIINQKINSLPTDNISSSNPGSSQTVFQLFRYNFSKIAALLIIIFVLGAVFARVFIKPAGYSNKTSMIEVVAPMGNKAMTSLPDGTKIWLNAGSTIEYSLSDKKNIREVFLTGEAYFEVAKNPHKPFIVNAGVIIIKAYGTTFNVKAYPEERVVEATLVEGSISVEVKNKPENRIMLNPDEQVFYYKPTSERNEKLLITKGINSELFTSWINDRLQISGETLESLAVKLERKYGMAIHFEDNSLKDLRFTGIIENETIEQVLELIKISSSVNYRIHNREIWLMNNKN
jgi:transmembrane sensor